MNMLKSLILFDPESDPSTVVTSPVVNIRQLHKCRQQYLASLFLACFRQDKHFCENVAIFVSLSFFFSFFAWMRIICRPIYTAMSLAAPFWYLSTWYSTRTVQNNSSVQYNVLYIFIQFKCLKARHSKPYYWLYPSVSMQRCKNSTYWPNARSRYTPFSSISLRVLHPNEELAHNREPQKYSMSINSRASYNN